MTFATAAPRVEEDPAQVLHPEAGLPRRRAHRGGRRQRARGAREAGLPVTVRSGESRSIHSQAEDVYDFTDYIGTRED